MFFATVLRGSSSPGVQCNLWGWPLWGCERRTDTSAFITDILWQSWSTTQNQARPLFSSGLARTVRTTVKWKDRRLSWTDSVLCSEQVQKKKKKNLEKLAVLQAWETTEAFIASNSDPHNKLCVLHGFVTLRICVFELFFFYEWSFEKLNINFTAHNICVQEYYWLTYNKGCTVLATPNNSGHWGKHVRLMEENPMQPQLKAYFPLPDVKRTKLH